MATLSRAAQWQFIKGGNFIRPSNDHFINGKAFLQRVCIPSPSVRRREVLWIEEAAKQVVRVPLHSAQGNVAASFEVLDIQPDRDVGQLSPLQLVDGARIPRARRVARDAAAVFRIFGQGEEGKILARGRGHASRLRTVASMPLTKSIALFTLRVRWRRIPA